MKQRNHKSRISADPNGIASGIRPADAANESLANYFAGPPQMKDDDPELRTFLCDKLPRKQMPANLLRQILEAIKKLP